MKINGIDFTIVGVTPQGFTGTMALVSPEVWMPLGMFDIVVNDFFKNHGRGSRRRMAGTVIVFGRLKEGVTPQVASRGSRRWRSSSPRRSRSTRTWRSP